MVSQSRIADLLGVIVSLALFFLAFWDGSADDSMRTAIVCAVISLIPPVLSTSGLISIPVPLKVMVSVATLLHGTGLALALYDTVPFYDTVTHTLSSAVVGICIFYVLLCFQFYWPNKANFGWKGLTVLTAMLSLTFSVYWEVIEFSSDVLLGTHAQYGPYDTLTDLVCDSIGTFLATAWVAAYMRNRTVEDVVDSFSISEKLKSLVFSKGMQ